MYKNWSRKYQGILAFRKHYKEILEIVCNYHCDEYSDNIEFLMDEIKQKTNIDEYLLKELWQYIPLILIEQVQEKAADIVSECSKYLDN